MEPSELQVQNWLTPSDTSTIAYSGYWNDEDQERSKQWDVTDGDYDKVESYLSDVGLSDALDGCLALARKERGSPLSGEGVDVAAGTLWAANKLLEDAAVTRLWCVEYSRHRLLSLGPLMLEHHEVDQSRVVLAYGSFYEMHIEDGSLDFAFLSQAFHHADRPEALLMELRRVLAPGGVVIIIGEHRLGLRQYFGYLALVVLSFLPARLRQRLRGGVRDVARTLHPTGEMVLPTDPLLGDHFYTASEYRKFFDDAGFRSVPLPPGRGSTFQSFVLLR